MLIRGALQVSGHAETDAPTRQNEAGVRRVPNLLRHSDPQELHTVCCTVAVKSVEDLQVSHVAGERHPSRSELNRIPIAVNLEALV